jgi:hypothetical protein
MEARLTALARRTIPDRYGREGITVNWYPRSDDRGEWVIRLAVFRVRAGANRRWVEVRYPSLETAVVEAENKLTAQGR